MDVSSPQRSTRRRNMRIFPRRKKNASLEDTPEMEESSESSLEEKDMKISHIGKLNTNFENQHSNGDTKELEVTKNTRASLNGNSNRIMNLILARKSRRKPFSDTAAPSRPKRATSFKMDGVPAFMSLEIEKKTQRDSEKRQKRHQAKIQIATAQLRESITSLSMPPIIRKQRPKVLFLDVPKDHPLYWDCTELPASLFPEGDRAFLAKLFKNPRLTVVQGRRLPTRVDLILRKMQLFDWDAATISRCATVLFNPESNPLKLSLAATKYFFCRFDALKESLVGGSPVWYANERYSGDEMEGLFERLRADFEEATSSFEVDQITTHG